jgi:Fe-S-cluster containining protein
VSSAFERPVWRRFHPRFVSRAAAWVQAGGFAALVDWRLGAVEVLLPVTPEGRLTELAEWALLSIEHARARRVTEGSAKGLRRARIRHPFQGSVLDWCERDSVHELPVRTLELDCIACTACCHDSQVLLDEADLERFRAGGRPELAKPPFVRRHRDGRIMLRLLSVPDPRPGRSTRCRELGGDGRCGIYELRPDNCRAFVRGSEACLAAREQTLHLRDGAGVLLDDDDVEAAREGAARPRERPERAARAKGAS